MADRQTNVSSSRIPQMRYQKIALGIIGGVMLIAGGLMYMLAPTTNVFVTATLIRAGMLLSVIWLAFDEVMKLSKFFPIALLGGGMMVLVLAAVRPNIGKLVMLLCGVLFALSAITKFVRKTSR